MIADDDGPGQRKMPYGFWKLRRMMAAATPSRIETCKHHGSQHRICFEGVCGKKWLPARRLCFAGVSGKKWLTAQPGSMQCPWKTRRTERRNPLIGRSTPPQTVAYMRSSYIRRWSTNSWPCVHTLRRCNARTLRRSCPMSVANRRSCF